MSTLLTKENSYYSPTARLPIFNRTFPSFLFYIKLARVVMRAYRLCKKDAYDADAWIFDSYSTLKALESVGVQFVIENLHTVARLDTPCVFVANHMSSLETFVLPCLIRPYLDFAYVVKQQLLETPIMKEVLLYINSIAVSRENPREDLKEVLTQGVAKLQNRTSIVIFPQTTRSANFDPNMFSSIGVKLAKKAGVPIVPIALKTDAWGTGKKLKDFGKIDRTKTVHFSFGKPLEITGNGRAEHEAIIDFLTAKLLTWN